MVLGKSFLKEINISYEYEDEWSVEGLNQIDTGNRILIIDLNIKNLPECDMSDLLIMISEELRFLKNEERKK